MNKCVKCGAVEVQEEFTRCAECEAQHKALCAKLEALPRVESAPKQELPYIEANVPGGKLYIMK